MPHQQAWLPCVRSYGSWAGSLGTCAGGDLAIAGVRVGVARERSQAPREDEAALKERFVLVGVVSDTHGYLDPRLIEAMTGVDAIVHAGDVGGLDVLEGLRTIAPVFAVQGNNDLPLGGLGLPEHLDIELAGASIHVVHQLPMARASEETGVVIFGHSHVQVYERRGGVLYLNPGAAGRRGFHAMQTAALLRIDGGSVVPGLLQLGPRLKLARTRATPLARRQR
jgi:putative phosphoesterase